jgi:two-component system chemotaxis sensor kinase CheA
MISAFIVRVSDWNYAINVGQIIELLYVEPGDVLGRDGRRNIEWNGAEIPLVELRYMLGLGGARVLHRQQEQSNGGPEKLSSGIILRPRLPVLISRVGGRPVAIAVDEFKEQREIIVKSLGSLARKIKGAAGAVDLEGGDVALVLDLPSLLLMRSMRL